MGMSFKPQKEAPLRHEVIEMSDDANFKTLVELPEDRANGGREQETTNTLAGATKKRGVAAGTASQNAHVVCES
ncbi:hypothetical protein Tco_1080829 [Tanacetum coccineum]|uniref:Uncharacterized protein n=1 Tax=Tanacetum coccineum TaxID=301880 RepID=A0ABQ5HWP3_9ASTR